MRKTAKSDPWSRLRVSVAYCRPGLYDVKVNNNEVSLSLGIATQLLTVGVSA